MATSRNALISTDSILQLPDKIAPLLLVTYYLLLQPFPSIGTVCEGNLNYLMNGLVNLLPIARSNLNTGLI
jgi:hypothetical protein